MSRFIESICILNGSIRNLELHQKRFQETRLKVFGLNDGLKLRNFIQISKNHQIGKYKCRIVYSEQVEEVTFIPYEIRKINCFKLIDVCQIDYSLKAENRQVFEDLKVESNAQEIIILQKGNITDTSYSNLLFLEDGNWFAPETYLLNGVMRQSLLNSGRIKQRKITKENLSNFSSFKLINALMDFDESPTLDISIII